MVDYVRSVVAGIVFLSVLILSINSYRALILYGNKAKQKSRSFSSQDNVRQEPLNDTYKAQHEVMLDTYEALPNEPLGETYKPHHTVPLSETYEPHPLEHKVMETLNHFNPDDDTNATSLEVLTETLVSSLQVGTSFPSDATTSSPKQERPKGTAPISLLIPCSEKDVDKLPQLFESIRNQTMFPNETILALSVKNNSLKLLPITNIDTGALPNVRAFLRGGLHLAGDNRAFLLGEAFHETVSFFDCDDYMHPQRIEIVSRAFESNPDLEAALHTFVQYSGSNWNNSTKAKFLSTNYPEEAISGWRVPWSYDYLWNKRQIKNYGGGIPWVADDARTEPNHTPIRSKHWWFPLNITLEPRLNGRVHNAWISGRKSSLAEVPYPNVPRGQDSLFNWRLMKSHHNFTILDFKLGAYLRK